MTCHHAKDDKSCGGYALRLKEARAFVQAAGVETVTAEIEELLSRTPNPDQYEIVRHEQIGAHLVIEVQYSSCKKCSFDSRKVMVHLHTDASAAMYWRRIDPHFGERVPDDHARITNRSEAPPPRARFPADAEGWADAIAYARGKS